jgi:hypothetical protein
MKYIILALLIFLSTIELLAQKPDSDEILSEGKLLYRLEKAAWQSTDHFLENFPDKKNSTGGYLSYEGLDGFIYSIFFSRSKNPEILARYRFEASSMPTIISVDLENTIPSANESDLITIRQTALDIVHANSDGFFTTYENTSLNPIPLILDNRRRVFILTASQKQESVFIGNDYVLEFTSNNELSKKTKLHNSLIELPYNFPNGQKATATMHTHVLSNLIESTDICTLLLYKDYVDWSLHYAVNKDYISIFDLNRES